MSNKVIIAIAIACVIGAGAFTILHKPAERKGRAVASAPTTSAQELFLAKAIANKTIHKQVGYTDEQQGKGTLPDGSRWTYTNRTVRPTTIRPTNADGSQATPILLNNGQWEGATIMVKGSAPATNAQASTWLQQIIQDPQARVTTLRSKKPVITVLLSDRYVAATTKLQGKNVSVVGLYPRSYCSKLNNRKDPLYGNQMLQSACQFIEQVGTMPLAKG